MSCWQRNLIAACDHGNVAAVEFILSLSSVTPEYLNKRGWRDGCTALMVACDKGHMSIVDHLLDMEGIDISIESNGMTAFEFACDGQHREIARKLIYKGAKDNPYMAIRRGDQLWALDMLAKRHKEGSTPITVMM